MEAIEFIKKTHKPYIGNIDNSYLDNEGRNYEYYKLLYCDYYNSLKINEYIKNNFKSNNTLLNLNKLIYEYSKTFNDYEDKTITIIISKDIGNIKKIIYKEKDNKYKCNIYINTIIIEYFYNMKEIKVDSKLQILNDMNIDYLSCYKLKCDKCHINTYEINTHPYKVSSDLSYISKNVCINKLFVNVFMYIKNINCKCNEIKIINNKDNIEIIKNINNFKKLIIDNNYHHYSHNRTYKNYNETRELFDSLINYYGNNKKFTFIDLKNSNEINEEDYKIIEYYYYGTRKIYFNDNKIIVCSNNYDDTSMSYFNGRIYKILNNFYDIKKEDYIMLKIKGYESRYYTDYTKYYYNDDEVYYYESK